MKLWQTSESGDDAVRKAVELFTVGDDWIIDQKLVRWDCLGSLAHATMLQSIGIISPEELSQVRKGLKQVLELSLGGKFIIQSSDEDCHTAIEGYLTENCGEVGKKIHTARSRNDQVLTAQKLFLKDSIFRIAELTFNLARKLIAFAKGNTVAFPGYTHMQKGMPSTITLWAASYAESLVESVRLLQGALEYVDSSPLGSAAGYGVTFPINREMTAKLLGFAKVQRNVITAQNSRGKNEAVVLGALATIMSDLTKFGADLLFYSQRELGYLILPERFCTGSSIMPQKRNPDVFELLRAKGKVVNSLHAQVLNIITDLPSGYNRDFQLTKRPVMEGLEIVAASLTILAGLVDELKVDNARCEAAMEPELFAADMANELVTEGKSFRDAYREVKTRIETLKITDPQRFIEQKKHTGAPGNPGILELEQELGALTKEFADSTRTFEETLSKLIG